MVPIVKPRLRPLPLTIEDLAIWAELMLTLPSTEYGNSWALCMVQDRRDADLMSNAMRARVGHWGPVVKWTRVDEEYSYTLCGGAELGSMAIEPASWRDICYFV
jgi:hypothetical protein